MTIERRPLRYLPRHGDGNSLTRRVISVLDSRGQTQITWGSFDMQTMNGEFLNEL